jgi:hypothetical protein
MPTKRILCQCSDPGCPVHPNHSDCSRRATTTVYRVDMEDETGTPMCDRCAEDAMDSGVFTTVAEWRDDDAEVL